MPPARIEGRRYRLATSALCALALLAACKGHHAHRAGAAGPVADAGSRDPSFTRAMRKICNSLKHADSLYTDSPIQRLGQASRWMKANIRHVDAIDFLNSMRGLPPDERATALREKARSAGIKHCALADYLDRVMRAKPDKAASIVLLAKLRSIASTPPQDHTGELVAACRQIVSCARSCLFAMAEVADGPRRHWRKSMSGCEDFAEFASEAGHEPWMKKLGTWIRKRVGALADKLLPMYSPPQAVELHHLCRQLHIPLKK